MKKYDLIVIGGDAGGMSAASQARRIDPDMTIAVFNKGEFVSFAACGMPYYIANDISDYKNLIAIDVESFIKKRNIEIYLHTEAIEVNFNDKIVTTKSGDKTDQFSYKKLVIATGARPLIPPIHGIDNEGIFFLRNLEDGIAVKKYITEKKPTSAIIIGGGFIGLEMAEAFYKCNMPAIILEKMESVAMPLSPEIRKIISKEIEEHNVTVMTGTDIERIERTGKGLSVITNRGTFTSEMVIASIGITPNTDFLTSSGIAMNDRGAIIVDEKSMTSITDVFAAGDCATVKNIITGEDSYMPLGTNANKQGRVAGLQAVGKKNDIFKGIVGTQFVKVFTIEVGKTGLNLYDAQKAGFRAETVFNQWKSRAGYFPGTKDIFLTMTVDGKSGKVIGGEVAGTDNAVLRTNIIATAIYAGLTVEDLAYLDLGYAPPFSPVWEPVNATAQKLIRR